MTKIVMDLLVWKNFLATTGGIQVRSLQVCGRGEQVELKMKENGTGRACLISTCFVELNKHS